MLENLAAEFQDMLTKKTESVACNSETADQCRAIAVKKNAAIAELSRDCQELLEIEIAMALSAADAAEMAAAIAAEDY